MDDSMCIATIPIVVKVEGVLSILDTRGNSRCFTYISNIKEN